MINIYLLILFGCTFFSAISQILLKRSADIEHENWIKEYLNWRVITAYSIYAIVLLLNIWAFTKVDLKYGAVIDTFTYVFVMLLSIALLHEKIPKGRVIGNILIMIGVIVYTLG